MSKLEQLRNRLEELRTEVSRLKLHRKNLNLNRNGITNLANSLSNEIEDKGFEVTDTTFFGPLTLDQTQGEVMSQDLFYFHFTDPVSNEEHSLVLSELVNDDQIEELSFKIVDDPEVRGNVLAKETFKAEEFSKLQRRDLQDIVSNLFDNSRLSRIQ